MFRPIARFGMALVLGATVISSAATPSATTQATDSDKSKTTSTAVSRAKQAGTTTATPVTRPAGQAQTLTTTPVATTPTQQAKTRYTAVAAPMSGEQIKWQVISGGGTPGTSTNYVVNGTIGQTAAGPGLSTSFKINQGFWQNFASSCCIGKRGNVNCTGVIDLGDLSALVSYLTGGGYVLCCYNAANVNGTGVIDLGDLSALVSYLTVGGFVLVNCP